MPRPPANLTLTKEEVAQWISRLHEAQEYVDELRKETEIYREAMAGNFPSPFPGLEESEQVIVNRIHRIGTQWIGAMYAQNPKVHLDPPWWTPDVDRSKVALNESLLNTEMRRMRLDQPVRKAMRSAFLDGWGWVKEGFHAELESDAEEVAELTTDWQTENKHFEYVLEAPEMLPQGVLPFERHSEHRDGHRKLLNNVEEKIRLISEKQQQLAMESEQNGVEFTPSPKIGQEISRLQAMASEIRDHIVQHDEVERKRDREGAAKTNERILAENCWVLNPHNSCVVWDKNATGPHDWRWVAELIIAPVEQLKAQKRLKNAEKIVSNYTSFRPGSRGEEVGDRADRGGAVHSPGWTGTATDDEAPDSLASFWKVWDLSHRRVIYIHEPLEEALDVKEWPHKYLDNAPLRMLCFEWEEDEFRPVSPMKFLMNQQLELNRYRTKAALQTRRDNRVAVADPRIPPEAVERIAEGEDGVIVQLEGFGVKPKDAISTVDWGSVGVDCYRGAANADLDLQTDSGLSEAHMGGGVRARTATAADIEYQVAGVNLDLKLVDVQDFVALIVNDVRALMRQYYSTPRWTELFWEGSKDMVSWKGTDLLDYDLRIEMGSSMAEDMKILRMQYAEAMNIALQMAQVGMREVNLRWLFERYLETFPNISDPEEAFLSKREQMPQTPPAPPPGERGVGPGRGQNQRRMPQGPQRGTTAQPALDLTKIGGG